MSFKLIICEVPHDCGEIVINAAKSAGSTGGTILMGRNTHKNGIVQLLGFGDAPRDIVLIIVDEQIKDKVQSAVLESTQDKKSNYGFMFCIDVNSFKKGGAAGEAAGVKTMANENSYEMINVIVNKGYAEDAMAAARKAGAGGGTIIGARGTAKEGDSTFFGVEIVPEKDYLMILVPSDKKDAIVQAIYDLPCLSKAGSGIVFCNQANDFKILGKK